ncbi:MAG TPA: OmpA family protein [Candidatus Eisenbacteria bacterium]|nr:OmpA family protein [Candidatus Eisenbacteria bacterium]
MRRHSLAVAASIAALVALSSCATKGYVRDQVASERAYTDSQLAMVRARADSAWTTASLAERLGSGDYSEVSNHVVQFAFDDYRLDSGAQAALDQLATELQSHPYYGLEVRGYCDAIGTERYNYKLGRERAEEVERYMIEHHQTPSNRVAIVSFGKESPVADNSTDDGRAQNRRVQVRVLAIQVPGEPAAANMP